VVLMIEMSSQVSEDLMLCCWGVGSATGECGGLAGEADSDWGGGEGFQKEVG
jgi:hypothetical protein